MVTAATATTGTNIDVNGIVSQLVALDRQPIAKLSNKEAVYQSQLSALGTIKGALATFQTSVQALSNVASFQAIKTTSSDPTSLSASTSGQVAAGVYSLEVSSLSQSQKLAAAGQPSLSDPIGSGAATTLTFDFGTISGGAFNAVTGTYTGSSFATNGSGTKEVSIDSTNNTLQGIRDAINAANMGVTASIVNDGSASPYRLAFSSNTAGSNNSMSLSVAGDATLSALLSNNPAGVQHLSETAQAQNANFKVNGVSVTKASNTISDVIQGVTFTLSKTTTAPVSLSVVRDISAVSSAVTDFVSAYNNLSSSLKVISAYDPATKKGGPLQGDSTIRALQTQLHGLLSQAVTGSGGLTSLAQIGISTQKDGSIALNSSKLSSAMTSNFNDIASLFASTGSGTDNLVSFNAASATAKPGNYSLAVTRIATQGTLAGNAVANTTISAGVNDALSLVINGVSTSITLAAGTYTAQSLASELQSKLNGSSALSGAGLLASVSQSGGILSIASANYGSSSSVASISGSAAPGLMGAAPVSTVGVDVAGTIDGVTAVGSGKKLTDVNGLSFNVNGGVLGARGSVSYSQGYGYSLGTWATSVLATDGVLSGASNTRTKAVSDSSSRRAAMEVRVAAMETRYRMQYSKLDSMLSSMSQTSTYLTQQLARL